jgi:hypothetical protein
MVPTDSVFLTLLLIINSKKAGPLLGLQSRTSRGVGDWRLGRRYDWVVPADTGEKKKPPVTTRFIESDVSFRSRYKFGRKDKLQLQYGCRTLVVRKSNYNRITTAQDW